MTTTTHTASCTEARTGYRLVESGAPDEYPAMGRLTPREQEAVLSCDHKDHDVVRLWWGWK